MRYALVLGLLGLAACSRGSDTIGTRESPVLPSLQYRTNPANVPGFISPCAGGQPQMQYNCAGVLH